MNKNKTLYQQPSCDILELRFEGMVCGSPWDKSNNTENLEEDGDMIGL